MTDEADGLEAATRLLRSGDGVPAPAVEPLRAVVRSGEQFFLSDQGVPDFFVGSHVIEWGYEVAPERAAEFRNWLAANEATLNANAPPGVRYRGTFAVTFQSDLSLGSYRTIWTFAALADLTKVAAADPASTFGRL